MSEYTTKGRVGLDELEAVGRRLIVDGYLRGGSVLTPGQRVWIHGNFQELKAIYVDSPDEGYRDFWDKLADQFDGASDGAIQLFAEIFLTNMLPLSSLLGRTKIGYLRRVLEMMEDPVEVPDDVVAATAVGAFYGGPGFNFGRYSQLSLLINFGLHLHTFEPAQRWKMRDDPLAFRVALAAVKTPNQPMQRGALCYLAFPKFFLSIVNPVHRRLIRDTFVSYLSRPVSTTWISTSSRSTALSSRNNTVPSISTKNRGSRCGSRRSR
ncbi:hypothetical protein GEO20_16480 [Rhodococcus erythropolis]|uniref:hypothetical protein n=1 Tax=Rhodococcus erythropolis TaxID=1833 RepID=UPI00129183B4|nr:hypothetical protein [Rhodococcus erythropolis]MQP33552.1 hypothetical protein [Rhodococcus erythropolis]